MQQHQDHLSLNEMVHTEALPTGVLIAQRERISCRKTSICTGERYITSLALPKGIKQLQVLRMLCMAASPCCGALHAS